MTGYEQQASFLGLGPRPGRAARSGSSAGLECLRGTVEHPAGWPLRDRWAAVRDRWAAVRDRWAAVRDRWAGPEYGTGGPYGTGGGQQPPTAIKTYRTQAIIIVVCSVLFGLLGLITGIPALIYSTRVTESLSRGDSMQAVNASRRARVLCWISVGIIALVWLIIIIAAVASGHNSNVTNTGNTGNT